MKRYIDAGEFWNNRPENLDPRKSEYNRGWDSYAKEILKALEDTPTADVFEVRHAAWIKHKEDCLEYRCSVCEYELCRNTNYCPNCGAKMDGERRQAEISYKDGFVHIVCDNDGCYASTDGCANEQEAARLWNRRADSGT